MQGWFHCRGEDKPIGAGVARQQMSSWLGGGLPVEEAERVIESVCEKERERERGRGLGREREGNGEGSGGGSDGGEK